MKSGRRARHREARAPISFRSAWDGGRRLSEGALVQGSVRARLLGLPLLRVDATVVLVPAVTETSQRVLAAEGGLAEAVRSINAGADILAEVRRNGRRA